VSKALQAKKFNNQNSVINSIEAECSRPRSRPKRPWREVVPKDSQACKWSREDAMDHGRWRKLMKDGRGAG